MLKKDIELGSTLYWNTTGANNSKISLKCEECEYNIEFEKALKERSK